MWHCCRGFEFATGMPHAFEKIYIRLLCRVEHTAKCYLLEISKSRALEVLTELDQDFILDS